MKFYKIEDQIIISDKALSVGEELIPNTTDAAGEKHVPVISVSGDSVKVEVGSGASIPSRALHRVDCAGDGIRLPDEMAEARHEA